MASHAIFSGVVIWNLESRCCCFYSAWKHRSMKISEGFPPRSFCRMLAKFGLRTKRWLLRIRYISIARNKSCNRLLLMWLLEALFVPPLVIGWRGIGGCFRSPLPLYLVLYGTVQNSLLRFFKQLETMINVLGVLIKSSGVIVEWLSFLRIMIWIKQWWWLL